MKREEVNLYDNINCTEHGWLSDSTSCKTE